MSWPDPLWTSRASCAGSRTTFFPERETLAGLYDARQACAYCPVFDQCASWGLEHYPDIPEGILFGFTSIERQAMWRGKIRFHDWRETDWSQPDPTTKRARAAREREAVRKGVKAVVDAYNLYLVEDMDERETIITAYLAWQEEQKWPTSYLQARDRLEVMAEKRRTAGSPRPRTQNLSTLTRHQRPECPNGHGKGPMYRRNNESSRRTHPGMDRWECYTCHTKVFTEIDEHLEQTA